MNSFKRLKVIYKTDVSPLCINGWTKKASSKKRIILGTGYPWYYTEGGTDDVPGPHKVGLRAKCHGKGSRIHFNIKTSGAWKKYKLIVEEV